MTKYKNLRKELLREKRDLEELEAVIVARKREIDELLNEIDQIDCEDVISEPRISHTTSHIEFPLSYL